LNNLPPGTWVCQVTDSLGCTATDSITITQPAVLAATDNSTNSTCKKANGSISVNPTGGTVAYTYSWSNGSGSNPLSNASAGLYTCVITDANGCTATITDSIRNTSATPAPVVITTSPTTLCKPDSILLTASGGNGSVYTWSTGSNADSIYVNASGTYTLTATNICGTASTQSVITVYSVPVAVIAGSGPVCPGDSIPLTASSTPVTVPPTTFVWSTGATGSTIYVHTAGNYTVTATNPCGTASTVSGAITVYNIAANFHANMYAGYNPLPVVFTDSSTTTAVSWSWNFGDGSAVVSGQNPTHTFTNSGTYTVTETVTDIHGCKSSYTRVIKISDLPSWIIVPNVFTPNGDGDNDNWAVKSQGISTFDAKVYDRWGVMMSDLKSPGTGWDGRTAGGELAVPGTYYYIIHATGDDGKVYDFKGFLMMIRQ
jgi:gliding motility-associated-like protein